MNEKQILSLYKKLSLVTNPIEEARTHADIVLLETGSENQARDKEIEVLQKRWSSSLSEVDRLRIDRRIKEIFNS